MAMTALTSVSATEDDSLTGATIVTEGLFSGTTRADLSPGVFPKRATYGLPRVD